MKTTLKRYGVFGASMCVAIFVVALSATASADSPEINAQAGDHDNMYAKPQHPLLGKKAPNFTLADMKGNSFALADQIGKAIIVVDFWATWCPPCRASLPILTKVMAEYANKNPNLPVIFKAINSGQSKESVDLFLQHSRLKMDVLLDMDGTVNELYGVTNIPQSVIIGKDGMIEAVNVGFSEDYELLLRKELDTLLGGKSLLKEEAQKPQVDPDSVKEKA